MWINALVIEKIKGFITYLGEENKDIIIHYPTLEPGRVVPMPLHLFRVFFEKGKVDYAESKHKEEQKREIDKNYDGLSF